MLAAEPSAVQSRPDQSNPVAAPDSRHGHPRRATGRSYRQLADELHQPGSLTSWPTAHAGWPPVLLIPGTSSVAHLRENVAGARIDLPADAVRKLSDGQGFLARPPNW
jgi:aryl-alcohol dehydrogenase-like predicted oxidoreductase